MNGSQYEMGGFYQFSKYTSWLLLLNFLFIASNLLAFLVFILFIPTISNTIFYFLALIPTGAAVSTLCYCLSISPDHTNISVVQQFIQIYRRNFIDVLKVWLPILGLFFIFIIDIQYFQQELTVFGQIMNGLFLVLLLLLTVFALYCLLIVVHFNFRVRDVYRLAVYYMFTRIKITTGNIGIGFLTLTGMFFISDFIILFTASLVAWFITMNSSPVLEDIRANFIKEQASKTTGE